MEEVRDPFGIFVFSDQMVCLHGYISLSIDVLDCVYGAQAASC